MRAARGLWPGPPSCARRACGNGDVDQVAEPAPRLAVELVLAPGDTSQAHRLAWQRRVAELAEPCPRGRALPPAVIPLLLTHRHTAPNSWRWTEAVLAALTEAGIAGPGTAALSLAGYPLLTETAKYARDVPQSRSWGNAWTSSCKA